MAEVSVGTTVEGRQHDAGDPEACALWAVQEVEGTPDHGGEEREQDDEEEEQTQTVAEAAPVGATAPPLGRGLRPVDGLLHLQFGSRHWLLSLPVPPWGWVGVGFAGWS
jgi:hypothetical protein